MKIKHKRFGYVGTVIATQGEFYNVAWDKRPEVLFNGGVKESLILKSEVEEVKEEEVKETDKDVQSASVYDYYYDI